MAKYLTERTEVAEAINFGKYPVLYIDFDSKFNRSSNGYYKGCDVRVKYDRSDGTLRTEGNLEMENGKYSISNNAICLHASFGRSDIIEDYKWSRAVTVSKGQTVVLIEDWSEAKRCKVRMMKVSDRINTSCMTVAYLEDLED